MRILYHHRTRSSDAQGIHISEMIQAFRNLGHEIAVAALVNGGGSESEASRPSLWSWTTQWWPNWLYELMSLLYNLPGYRKLCVAIRRQHPDLIYERYSLNTFCGIWASRRFNIPIILEVNSPLCYEQSWLGKLSFKRLARASERWICSHATRTIVVTGVLKEFLVAEGVPRQNLVVIHNGVDPSKFHPQVSGKRILDRYGLHGNLVIGFVGWFRKWHGLEMLLHVMRDGNLAEKGVRLLMVGDGPAFKELHDYALAHDLLSSVFFTGPVDREGVSEHIAAMDVTVQPSATEYACPMKIIEYMGMGKCIVAPDQANIRELLDDGETGFLFRSGDKESLRRVLMELTGNRARIQRTGHQAYQKVFERGLLWEENAKRTLSLVLNTGTAAISQKESTERLPPAPEKTKAVF